MAELAQALDRFQPSAISEIFRERRNHMNSRLNMIEGTESHQPEGAFYLYPSCVKLIGKTTPKGIVIQNSNDFVKYLLTSRGVAVVSGEAFEYDPNFRLSYATSMETLTKAADRIEATCKNLSER
jgi:aspartate aminotransferase